MAMPEYTDGVLELLRIEEDNLQDFPVEKVRSTGMHIWYRELSVFDTTRAKLSADGIEVTMKISIPQIITSRFSLIAPGIIVFWMMVPCPVFDIIDPSLHGRIILFKYPSVTIFPIKCVRNLLHCISPTTAGIKFRRVGSHYLIGF